APEPGGFAAIACHGVLGESVRRPADLDAALDHLAAALLPGGVLSLAHRFREDRSATLAAAIARAVERHGLERLGPDLLRRPRTP
ncbi:MAG: hypothetical protein KDD82_28015, partial [Planctomycetes bacterium]|nr:hypothetical protein [Planctomycetota bacterium]